MITRRRIYRRYTHRAILLAAASFALLRAHRSSAATFTWTGGGGANNSWTTPANWGGVAPSGAGSDVLIFNGVTNSSTVNDFPATTTFTGINFTASAGTFTLSGNNINLAAGVSDLSSSTQTISLAMALGSPQNFSVASGGTLILGGVTSGAGAGIIKNDVGTLTLTNSNTYTGPTTINGGTLKLDFNAAGATSILNPSSKLALGSGSLFLVGSVAGSVQTLGGTTLNPGAGAITPSVTVLNLGAITRNAGSTVQFNIATGGVNTTTPNANFAGGQQTILGGYATVGGNTWAVAGTGGGNSAISGLSTYSAVYATGADVDSPATATVPSMTINSLRINSANTTVSFTGPITIATGGILVTSNVANAGTLTGSTITSGNGQDLIVNNNCGTILSIASQITGNIGLTLTAPSGQLWLNNAANNYTGNTVINSGRLSVNTTSAINSVPVNSLVIVNGSVNGGGQLYTNTAVSIANSVQLSGVGRAESGGSYGAFRMKGGTMSGNIALIGNARIGGNNDYTISGQITGPFEAEIDMGNANSATGNTLTLSNASNNYSGGTRISRGTLSLGATGALPANTLLSFGSTQPTGSVGVESTAAPILNLNSNAASVSGITIQGGDSTATGAGIVNSGALATLTVNNSDDFTFGGTISNSIAITKNGVGRQTFSGSNSYAGLTTINAGVVSVTGTISTSLTNVNTSASAAGTLAGTGRLAAVTLVANNGSNRARVTPGATSAAGDVGTLTMNSLSVAGGNFIFDLGASAASSDSINVIGNATFNGAATITPIGAAGAASYTLLSATALTLNTLPTLDLVAGSPSGYSLDFSTPNTIRLVNAVVPVTLFWTGATDNQWDVGSTQNWTDTNVATTFANANIVNFVNGALNQNIAITGTVQPAAINVTNDGSNAYTFAGSGAISSSGTLTKNGSGLLTITNSGSNQFARVSINGGTVVFANQNSLGTLTIAGGTARLSPHAANNDPAFVTIVPDLSITAGTLDLNNNAMIVDYSGSSPLLNIRAALATGFAGGSWNGIGIDSASASGDATHKSALGYAEASTLGVGSFAGHVLADNSAVLVRYTLSGDANLDGLVNALDFNALATNFGGAGTTLWTQGDFNFDGQINSMDFNSLAGNFNGTLPAPAVSLATVVPEPLLVCGAVPLLLLARTRRVKT